MNSHQPYREYRRSIGRSRLCTEVRCRRIFPFLGIFIASGFLVLEGVDQLIGHAMLPDIAYSIALVFYAFGIPGTAIVAWFHGERGPQRPTLPEVWMEGFMVIGAIGICFGVVRSDAATVSAAQAAGQNTVIVVPLTDGSADGAFEGLVDAITDSVVHRLDRAESVEVVSPDLVRGLYESGVPAERIARLFGAQAIVSGDATRAGERGGWVQVTAKVTGVDDGVDDGVVMDEWTFETPLDTIPCMAC